MIQVNLNSELRTKAIREQVHQSQKPARPKTHYFVARQILREVLSDKDGALLVRRTVLDKAARLINDDVYERLNHADS